MERRQALRAHPIEDMCARVRTLKSNSGIRVTIRKIHCAYRVQNPRLVCAAGQDKLTNRIDNRLLLKAYQLWRRNSDTVPAHQSVGHWVRARSYRYQHLRYEEVSIRKKEAYDTQKRKREK